MIFPVDNKGGADKSKGGIPFNWNVATKSNQKGNSNANSLRLST